MRAHTILKTLGLAALGLSFKVATGAEAAAIEEIEVVGTTPGAGLGLALKKIPFAVQSTRAADLESAQSLDLSDYMNQRLGTVNINSAQNNPLQADVQFRGFTASPLLGLPQGIAVYQNGVRINEPLGDAVNWDLLPESAVAGMDLISGANPLYGLNTLGGALAITMKNGFNFSGQQAEVYGGSFDRVVTSLESGGNNGRWGYYLNLNYFDEQGWRAVSDSDSLNLYGSLNWRNEEISTFNLNVQKGDSKLRGNGAVPVGLLAIQRDAIFTAPDITDNDMSMLALDGSHFVTPGLQLAGSAFWRENKTDSFNGDASEFELCEFSGGNAALFEEADAVEDQLDELLGIDLDEICTGADAGIDDFSSLEAFIGQQALQAGLEPEDFALEDVVGELSGSGVLSDEAINNISHRRQRSRGFDGKLTSLDDLFAHGNRLTIGFSYFRGTAAFDSVLELSRLDPVTRSTAGLGTGAFVDTAATSVDTRTETLGFYFTDTIDLTERLFLTVGGRYNDSDIRLRDRSGERPELDGDHHFSRFNPSVGLSYSLASGPNIYASWSESNRMPTPIELACNEGVFELAQQFALERGEDPEDIDFECRLPNAFLADPPLDDVVTRSVELGVRGDAAGINYQLGLFRASNRDDIIFQTTGRATGLFANVDRTRRQGLEASLRGSSGPLQWYASYSYIEATFQDDFAVLSPNHPNADASGSIAVQRGDRLPGIPQNLLKLGADYRFGKNFSIGVEALHNSAQVLRGDESNDLDRLDGFTLFNLRASYSYRDTLTIFARASNIFDKKYENFGLLGENPDEVLPDLADTRPLFLGAGAPRAAWLGLRVRF
ncbi:MAG: TonB-dependent receptor [Pseudomonadales bacterium]|nr:TonB-dependent receptor [Pseudomonadales bacterium]